MSWQHFDYTVEEGVATVRFNRPATLNSLTFDVYLDLVKLTTELAEDDSVKVLVLTGTGRGFCSGGDVNAIMGPLQDAGPEELLAFTRMTCQVVRNLRRMPQPVIAAVNGTAAGAGAVIAIAADLRTCAEGARFLFLFTKVGLTGADMGAAWLLPRLVGAGRAMEALLFGEAIDARQGLEWGLVHRVVPPEQLADVTTTWARHLARGPQAALRCTKRALNAEASMDLDAALDFEATAQALLLAGRDHREFYRAHQEKRPPRWSGCD